MMIDATEFEGADEALRYFYRGRGDLVLNVAGRFFVTTRDEAHRMQAAGVKLAFVHRDEQPDGSTVIVTVPAN